MIGAHQMLVSHVDNLGPGGTSRWQSSCRCGWVAGLGTEDNADADARTHGIHAATFSLSRDREALLKVAQALLMFHQSGPWTVEDRERWTALTGATECTTKSLCDFARATLQGISK